MTPALTSLYYDLSAVYSQQGFGFPEGGMTLTGLRFVERNSGLGKLTVYFVTQLFMALGEGVAASSGRYVGSSYGPGYRVDYYRRYSQAELNDMRAARESAGDAMLSSNMSLDLQLYLPIEGRSTASGISVELTPITFEFSSSGQFGLEVGFSYTKLSDVVPGDTRLRSYETGTLGLGDPMEVGVIAGPYSQQTVSSDGQLSEVSATLLGARLHGGGYTHQTLLGNGGGVEGTISIGDALPSAG